MSNAPKNCEVTFIVSIYKDMELADEVETCNSFYTYESALSFYNEVVKMYGEEQFIELRLEIDIDNKCFMDEQLANNYNIGAEV